MRIGSLFLLQAALTLMLAQSRVPAWRHIGYDLPTSASVVEALIADPGDPATVYGITDRNLLYKSTDGSNSWRALSGVTGVYSLLIDPRNPATLYAGASHGVLKSTDGGSTWSGINAGLPPGWPAWVQVLAIDPANSSVLYVEKWQGLLKSTDGGQSWTSLNARFYASDSATTPLADIQVQHLFIDPTQPSTLYAGPGAFKSIDGGATWYPIPITGANTVGWQLLGLDAAASTLYVSYFDNNHQIHIAKSKDQGATWTPADGGFPDWITAEFIFDPANAGTIYASYVGPILSGGAPPAFGVVKSTDGGETWTAINTAIPGRSISSFAAGAGSTLYASYGSTPGGIFKSADGGANWAKANAGPTILDVSALAIDPGQQQVIYAADGLEGVFKSVDRGTNWSNLAVFQFQADPFGPVPEGALSLAIGSGASTLYAWGTCLLFKSTDGGANWNSNASPPANCLGSGAFLSIDPHDANSVYLAESSIVEGDSSLMRTTDGGGSWSTIWGSVDSYLVTLLIDPLTPTTIYAGTSGGLFKSIDGGANWSDAGLHSVVNALAIDSLNPNMLYAATTTDDYSPPANFGGLFKSSDAGANWVAIDDGLEVLIDTGAAITSLTIDPANPQVLYAGTSGNGIFRSADGGAHWSPFNRGLTNLDVHVLAAGPGNPGLLYASTSGGIFATPLVSDGPGRRGN
ncbi:conserved hypothetical protein [Candidatus Sulfopaludibacter sp. SbA6]|nr:conserved hypothetical protein [Candidatus Sulfopaludibacter sp. SbA6]